MAADARQAARSAAELAARTSYGKLLAFLSARSGDLAGAQDALSDAFEAALTSWPDGGIPNTPDAWLLTVARRNMIDMARHRSSLADIAVTLELLAHKSVDPVDDWHMPDQRLALMFVCAHPSIAPDVRAPLILQTVLGLDAATIASSFLVAPAVMSQRLVRAKNKIRQAAIPFAIPDRPALPERTEPVMDAIYASYSNGWTDQAGTELRRLNLAGEAIWLGRLVAMLMPDQAEPLGLLALMLYTEARRDARRSESGAYIPLSEQDPLKWNNALIDEAESLLQRANSLGGVGRYQLEAAIQSAHVIRRQSKTSDWSAIAVLYEALFGITRSPVVAINRAVALAQAGHPGQGLEMLDELRDDARLANYQPYWAARAQLLEQTGCVTDAIQAYERAIGLETDPSVRVFLQGKQKLLAISLSA